MLDCSCQRPRPGAQASRVVPKLTGNDPRKMLLLTAVLCARTYKYKQTAVRVSGTHVSPSLTRPMHSGLVSRRDAAATCDRAARHGMAWHRHRRRRRHSVADKSYQCLLLLPANSRQAGRQARQALRHTGARRYAYSSLYAPCMGPPRPPPRRHRHHRSFLRRIVPASPGESLAVGRAPQPCAVKVIQVKVTLDVTAREDVLSVSCRSMAAKARH